MARYAQNTSVAPDRSRAEIERTLARYGATGFMYGWDHAQAVLGFVMRERQIRFLLPLPDRDDVRFARTPTGRERAAGAATEAWEQAIRQAWRALSLAIKAKLEAVEAGIVSFEAEFGMHMVLPDGRTVAEHVEPRIAQAYASNTVPELLPSPSGSSRPGGSDRSS